MTQAVLASAIGVKVGTLQGYEANRIEPPLFRLEAIAKATGVNLDYLLGGSDELTITTPEQREQADMDAARALAEIRAIINRGSATEAREYLESHQGEHWPGIRELLSNAALCKSIAITDQERDWLLHSSLPVGPATAAQAIALLMALRQMPLPPAAPVEPEPTPEQGEDRG